MYKIYINDTPLFLMEPEEMEAFKPRIGEDALIVEYRGKSKMLFNYIDLLEKSPKFSGVVVFSKDFQALVNDFASLYKIVEASGGLVMNELDQLLVIFRRGRWDLPKGKLESGETKEQAALREVKEETGLKDLEIGEFIGKTYHTYLNKSRRRCIKKSYWYEMKTRDNVLVPQTEEQIESANWIEIMPFLENEELIYPNIEEIIKAFCLKYSIIK